MKDRSSRGVDVTPADWTGENESGIQVYDYKVLVMKDTVEETSGSIILTQETRDIEKWRVVGGVIVSHGGVAFTHGRFEDGKLIPWSPTPKVGTRVLINENRGMEQTGKDGKLYGLYTDKDIIGEDLR